MSKEDKDLAQKMAQADFEKTATFFRQNSPNNQILGYGSDGMDRGGPDGDGDRMFIPVTIGGRGSLSKQRARIAARAWLEATQRYPKAFFMISLLGYDEDPREIWQIQEAARYVRWWAKYAGMDDVESADRFLGPGSAIGRSRMSAGGRSLGFLAACGVFGEETKQRVLAGFAPTSTN